MSARGSAPQVCVRLARASYSHDEIFHCIETCCLVGRACSRGACTTKPKPSVDNTAACRAAAGDTGRAVTSSIVPGSAEDFRVNVGDTVHFAYNEYNNLEDRQGDAAAPGGLAAANIRPCA